MSYKVRRIARARDPRADLQMEEVVRQSDLPPAHADTHKATGSDPITPSSIGAETPAGAQSKVDAHESKANPHSGSQPISSFATADRPTGVPVGYMGFDTDLGKPIWWNGSEWVDSTGTIV